MRLALLTLFVMVSTISVPGSSDKYRFEQLPDGVEVSFQNYTFRLQVCSPRIFHIICAPGTELHEDSGLFVNKKWGPVEWELIRKGESLIIKTAEASVDLDVSSILCRFFNASGEMILEENERAFSPTNLEGEPCWNVFETFKLSPDEGIYGLGQHQNGWLNHREKEVTLVQTESSTVIPFLVSTKGWGILWNNYSKTYFRDNRNGATFWSEYGNVADYYLFIGRNIDEVIAGYRNAMGIAPLFGKWAYGFWQSKERYQSFKELADVVAEYRTRRLPMDVIVQDWRYGSELESWSPVEPDPRSYPEPEKNLDIIHNRFHAHLVISIQSGLGKDSTVHWIDGTEPELSGRHRNVSFTRFHDINARYDVLRRQISTGLNLSVSGIPYWTTDIGGSYIEGNDHGFGPGLYPGGCKDPAYKELYVRWFQFGAFCPIFRAHGTQTPRELWQFGDPGNWAYEAMSRFLYLRYRLLPYIYSVAWNVTSAGGTMIRPLAMDFSDDKKNLDLDNEYLFGPSILVCPVTEEQYFPRDTILLKPRSLDDPASMQVYLPKGANWIDFWTGVTFEGGKIITRDTPVDILPLYIKSGSIIPMGPFLQYADEKPADPVELRVYPGADASFTLFEDEGDTYNYEKGKYSTINFNWNDESATLSIGARKGDFPGMLQSRSFRIVLVSPEHGIGVEITSGPDKVIQYHGAEIKIKP